MIRQRAGADTGGPGMDPGSRARGGDRRRAIDPWKIAFFVVMTMAIVVAGAWALLGSSLLAVKSVRVTGTRRVPTAAVVEAAGIRYGTPLIGIDAARAARQVERLAPVQSAQVSRDWPDTVLISVRERTPALAIARQGAFEIVDEYGVIVASAASAPPGLPLLHSPPGALRGSAQVRAAAVVLRELPARLRDRVTAVDAPAASQVTLDMRGGVRVQWGGPGRSGAKMAELAILMRGHASYYDVSDPGTAATGG